jgi:hypothetical protein
MPIRFYCCFCHQLLGIATRKAGTVIECPTCKGQVWVPRPDEPGNLDQPPPAFAGSGSAQQAAAGVELIPVPPDPNLYVFSSRQAYFLAGGLVAVLVVIFSLGVWVGRLMKG